MFDMNRAKTYTRGALALTMESAEPALYFKGGWAGNPGKSVSPELATFLQKGCKEDVGDASSNSLFRIVGTLPQEVLDFLAKGLVGLGYGAQILPGRHFTMSTGNDDVYGCAVGGTDGQEPLAYQRALPESAILATVDFLGTLVALNEIQRDGVRLALRSLGMKVAPIQAYQVDSTEDAQAHVIETVVNGRVESVSHPEPGDWIVKQAAGEVQIIKASTWTTLGYVEIPR